MTTSVEFVRPSKPICFRFEMSGESSDYWRRCAFVVHSQQERSGFEVNKNDPLARLST